MAAARTNVFHIIFAVPILTVLSAGSLSAHERVKFPVGVGTKTLGTGLIWLANKKGFFDDVGLDVQPVLLRETPMSPELARKGWDYYIAGMPI